MKKTRKLFFFIITFFIVLIALIIYRYERLLVQTRKEVRFDSVAGGSPGARQFNAQEIIALIRQSKEYLGDSVTIFENGDMKSNNNKFQGTIQAVISSKDNMDVVKSNMASNKLPLQYNIYVLAATYYRNQYASEIPTANK